MNKHIATALSVALAGALTAGSASAAFQIKKEHNPAPSDTATVFDHSEYSVWVDNTYQSVHEYGKRGYTEAAPSYGDPMPLADALQILVPNAWKVLRAKSLEQQGKLLVSWDMESATWIGVLQNLGERHGMQFHIDHNRKEVFVKDGRRLIFDRPVEYGIAEQYPRAGTERIGQQSQTTLKTANKDAAKTTASLNAKSPNYTDSAFTIYEGDSAKGVMTDLALVFGYNTTHWLIDDQQVQSTKTFTGDAMHIMASVAQRFGGRVCLYETDMSAAIIPKTMECPK